MMGVGRVGVVVWVVLLVYHMVLILKGDRYCRCMHTALQRGIGSDRRNSVHVLQY